MAKVWTDKKLLILKNEFGTIPNSALAAKLGISERALSAKVKTLKLKPKPLKQAPEEPERVNSNVAITGGEKIIKIEDEEVEMIPSGLMIKTEDGWKPVMVRKSRVTK